MSTDTTTVQPRSSSSHSIPPRGPGRRPLTRWIVGGAGIALVGLVIGLAGSADSKGSSDPTGPKIEAVGTDLGQPAVELAQSGATPVIEEPAVELDQSGDSQEVDEPQPPAVPLPATLSVTPDPVHLKTGVYSGSITVSNIGDEAMQWSALTKPWVSLSDTTGDLGAHGANVITFQIDESQLDGGSFTFKIKVWGNGGTTYVDVTGAKPLTEISA